MLSALAIAALLAVPRGMARIPAGSYRPLYATSAARTRVGAFAIDREPVSRNAFLLFVREHAEWRRSAIKREFAERDYLNEWRGDLDAGESRTLAAPVRHVSWFAARAYCEAQGKRLPTTDEWEYVAVASETQRDATSDPAFLQRLLDIYTSHTRGFRNVYGVSGLHGGPWEWTDDFNGVALSDDSRAAGSGVDARDHDLFCAGAALHATNPGNYPAFMRAAVRAGLTGRTASEHVGFRCAADLP